VSEYVTLLQNCECMSQVLKPPANFTFTLILVGPLKYSGISFYSLQDGPNVA